MYWYKPIKMGSWLTGRRGNNDVTFDWRQWHKGIA